MFKVEDIYLRSPFFIKRVLFGIYARRISKLKFQKHFYTKLQELEKTQSYSITDLQALQLEKLKAMVNHCYDNVPYYRKLFNEIKLIPCEIRDLKDIQRIPVLTRKQVKDNFSTLIAKNIPKNQRLVRNTSGTTGSPMYFSVDKKSYSLNRAYMWRYWKWAGFNFNDKRISIQGRRIISQDRTKVPFWTYNKWDKQLFFSTYHLSEKFIPYYVDEIFKFSPQAIEGYPSAIYVLAKYMEDNHITYKTKSVFTSSETLYAVQRETIEKVFQCKIFDKYGLSEMFSISNECEYHEGLHLNMEYMIAQVLDSKDEPVSPDMEGRIVCTGLENLSMPLIRYDTGDLGKILSNECSCGRKAPLMAPVTTKAEDQILTPDGRYISGSLLTFPFKPMKNIVKSQIIQDDFEHIRVKIVKNAFYNNDDSKVLLAGLLKCLGNDIKITLEFVDDIARTKNGKYRWVISNVHRKMDFEKNNI